MLLGKVVEVALRAVEIPLAEKPARSDCDLRLSDVISGAPGIVLRVEEAQHPFPLMRHHEDGVYDETDRPARQSAAAAQRALPPAEDPIGERRARRSGV